MPKYPYQTEIEVSRLRLDTRNPRVPSVADSQRQALEALAAEQKGKLVVLARHIVEQGLSPAQRFIVIPYDEDSFIVLDANRRLAALKLLEHPELAQGILSDGQLGQIRTLANRFDPPEDVSCVVFEKREDADVWVELLHEGQGDGAGLVEWSAQQKARHRARGGSQPAHMQVLGFVMQEGNPASTTEDRNKKGDYPVSTLERALSSPYLRGRLGIDVQGGRVLTQFPKEEVLKGLTKMVDEIAGGTVKVGQVMSREDRIRYADHFSEADLPAAAARGEDFTPLADAPTRAESPKDRKPSSERKRIIPSEFSVHIPAPRINDIYHELKTGLIVRDVPNAVAVLFRTFVELSIEDYIRRHLDLSKLGDKKLAQKQEAVLVDLLGKGLLDKKDLVPVRLAVAEPADVSNITNLNAFVHNPQMSPVDSELKQLWHRYEKLIRVIWA
jgi:hypothetical protein